MVVGGADAEVGIPMWGSATVFSSLGEDSHKSFADGQIAPIAVGPNQSCAAAVSVKHKDKRCPWRNGVGCIHKVGPLGAVVVKSQLGFGRK